MSDAWTLRGGTIVDGTGAPSRVGDVVIEGDRITSVGGKKSRGTVIDVDGLVVAPGFIDIHSHVDWILPLPDGQELVAPNVQQGITTAVAGNCGASLAPFDGETRLDRVGFSVTQMIDWRWRSVAEFLDWLERNGMPMNVSIFVGHNTLRMSVIGEAQRPAMPSELREMQRQLDEGLDQGALGLSIGLEYFPGRYAGPSEIGALAKVVAEKDGTLATHTRGISALYEQAVAEVIEIALSTGCRLEISHVNPMGHANWKSVDNLFEQVEQARAKGLDVGYDMVTYNAWMITTLDILPHFVPEEWGLDGVLALAATEDGRSRLRNLIESTPPEWPSWIEHATTRNIVLEMGWENLILAEPCATEFARLRGKTLGEISTEQGRDPFDLYFDLLVASRGEARIVNVGYAGDFEDDTPLRHLVEKPDGMPGTDTVLTLVPEKGPRLTLPLFWGTMPRFIGHFARDLGLVTLENAVHRMTQLPAERVKLAGRGVLAEGAFADVTVFDWDTISDRGTYLDPEPAAGIQHVFVNGRQVTKDGECDVEVPAGRGLRRGV